MLDVVIDIFNTFQNRKKIFEIGLVLLSVKQNSLPVITNLTLHTTTKPINLFKLISKKIDLNWLFRRIEKKKLQTSRKGNNKKSKTLKILTFHVQPAPVPLPVLEPNLFAEQRHKLVKVRTSVLCRKKR